MGKGDEDSARAPTGAGAEAEDGMGRPGEGTPLLLVLPTTVVMPEGRGGGGPGGGPGGGGGCCCWGRPGDKGLGAAGAGA